MKLLIRELLPEDAKEILDVMRDDGEIYRKYFTPFSLETDDLRKSIASAENDKYWGVTIEDSLAAMFMMRGLDKGHSRPSFGVYVGKRFAGMGIATLTLHYSFTWCRLNEIEEMMLKVYPDNARAMKIYEKAGMVPGGVCPETGQSILTKGFRRTPADEVS